MSNFLILVPARYGSSRFPGKPLAKINTKCMIEYVMQNCTKTGFDWSVVTDNDEIENEILRLNGNVVRVDDDVPSGSERIALAYERYFKHKKTYDLVINVQGDEPLLGAEVILSLAAAHMKTTFDIYTAVKKRSMQEKFFSNPNIVKCIKSSVNDQCYYFSRAAIPFMADSEVPEVDRFWYQHIGVYLYKPNALLKFVKLKQSLYEKCEKLEQLRAIENGLTIGAKELDIELIGVDTPEDIKKVEGVLSEQKN